VTRPHHSPSVLVIRDATISFSIVDDTFDGIVRSWRSHGMRRPGSWRARMRDDL
jgi:hypothetical protein